MKQIVYSLTSPLMSPYRVRVAIHSECRPAPMISTSTPDLWIENKKVISMNKATRLLAMTGMALAAAVTMGAGPASAATKAPAPGPHRDKVVGYFRTSGMCERAGNVGELRNKWDDHNCDRVRFGFHRGMWELTASWGHGPFGHGHGPGPVHGPGPFHHGPTHGFPVHHGPMHGGPVHSGPTHGGPVHTGPTHSGPVHTGPTHTGPVHTGPTHSGPTSLGH
jgi:hypothetical protein